MYNLVTLVVGDTWYDNKKYTAIALVIVLTIAMCIMISTLLIMIVESAKNDVRMKEYEKEIERLKKIK